MAETLGRSGCGGPQHLFLRDLLLVLGSLHLGVQVHAALDAAADQRHGEQGSVDPAGDDVKDLEQGGHESSFTGRSPQTRLVFFHQPGHAPPFSDSRMAAFWQWFGPPMIGSPSMNR